MIVGDLVRLIRGNELGIIINVITDKTDDPLDMMFPYNVLIDGYDDDWYGIKSLELISESR